MKKLIRLTLIVLCFAAGVKAQTKIEGHVVDNATNEPLIDALVSSTDNSVRTATDESGKFNITSNSLIDSVKVTYAGYKTQTFAVKGGVLNLALTQSSYNLNEVIVSANRENQLRTEVPLTIQTISKNAINETKATRLDMLINKIPGAYMVDLGNEQHSMALRQPLGYSSIYLYLEDGIPIRTVGDFNHNALIEINQASMQRIEVIKGPASSLYGSEAVGGAINFITQSPSLTFTPKVQTEIGSFGYKRGDAFVSTTIKNLGLYVGGYYANQNQAENEHNNFHKGAFTFRADYTFNSRTKLSAVTDYINYFTDQKGGLDSAHFYNKDYTSNYRFTYRKVNAYRLKTSLNHEWSGKEHTNFTLLYRNTTIGQNPFYSIGSVQGNPLKAKGQINEDAFQSYGAIIQHSKSFNFLNAKLIAGVSGEYSPATYNAKFISIDVTPQRVYYAYTATDSLLTDYNVDLFNTAIYTQFEFNPVSKMKFIAAARYDRMDYKFNNHLSPSSYTGAPSTTNNYNHFTPKVGLTYGFTSDRGMYANYSVGFSPPNITDLYRGVTVPTLKPSSYNNYELGGWYGFAGGKGYLEASLYQLDGTDEIVSTRLPDGTYQNTNAGKTRHRGFELSIKYAPVEDIMLRIGGGYGKHTYEEYVQQGVDYSGKDMSQAPEFITNSEITYKPSFFRNFRIAFEWQGMSSYYTDPLNTQKYDGFNIFNARAGYAIQGFELWVNCLNLADKTYATTVEKSAFGTSYRPGQLRGFNVGISYLFNKNNP